MTHFILLTDIEIINLTEFWITIKHKIIYLKQFFIKKVLINEPRYDYFTNIEVSNDNYPLV